MKKLIVLLPIIPFLVFFSVGSLAPIAHAAYTLPHNQCFGENCDGVDPPCNTGTESLVNEKTVYDSHSVAIGHLDLFHAFSTGGGCAAWSVGLKNITSATYYEVDATFTYEAGYDSSFGGLCCNEISGSILPPGGWFSSVLLGERTDGSACYHGYSTITDPQGHVGHTNTNTYCY
jgi:hypothetical protein